MPPVCHCTCSKRQHDGEMQNIVLEVSGELPDYLSILRNSDEFLISDNKFQFTDPCLNGLVLDPYGLQMQAECMVLQVWHPCIGCSPGW